MIDFELYREREQTAVKHFILAEYLQRFGPIIGSWCSTITYVDCFSGPWKETSQEFKDTSFAIALEELRKARTVQRELYGRDLRLRAFFVEKDGDSYRKLEGFANQISKTDIEIETRHEELENCIDDIVKFVRAGQSPNFPFFFIDPTGWTGFSLNAIEPLLKLDPGEVLINFMTSYIHRLIEHPEEGQQEGFTALYGPIRGARVLERVKGKSGLEREDILVSEYMHAIRETGNYPHASAAIVLKPAIDRTHFHLIYGTRDPKGLEVFKNAEKKAMNAMQQARADARDRRRDNGQQAFDFRREVPKQDNHYDELRNRYTQIAQEIVRTVIEKARRISYDEVYCRALRVPLTFESDLKQWINEWKNEERLKIDGLREKERVPKLGENHYLIWTDTPGPATSTR